METYHIRTKVFDGPLDLLLTLIEKRKLLINDIALAEVADDYLRHLEKFPELPVAETAQFVLIGSTLLLIKSKSLLPVLMLTSEEKDSIADLELRLKLFERYKNIAVNVLSLFGKKKIFGRKVVRKREVVFSPDSSMTKEVIQDSMHQVLRNLPKQKPMLPKTVVQKVISLEEMMDTLSKRINESINVSFRQFSAGSQGGKMNMIVSFLAMLELVRQGIVQVEQDEQFSDIRMQREVVGLPRYG